MRRMLTAVELTFDCADSERMAAFWKAAVGYVDEPPPAPYATRTEWLASLGEPVVGRIGGAWLVDPAAIAPRLTMLEVPEPKVAKNRLHLDLRISSEGTPEERWRQVSDEAQRLVAAGATIIVEHAGHHVVLADPEGNEFCIA